MAEDEVKKEIPGTMQTVGVLVFNEDSNDINFRIESNGDANVFFVDAGNDWIGMGTATPISQLHLVDERSLGISSVYIDNYGSDGTNVSFRKSGGTIASPTIITNGSGIGGIYGLAYDGNSFEFAAGIDILVDGTPGDGDMPGRLVFYTTPDGLATTIERLRINNAGVLILGTADQGTTARTGNTFRASDMIGGTTSDAAGADLTVSAGLGTGVGDVGQIIFQTPRVVGAGSTIQTRSTLLTLDYTNLIITGGRIQEVQGTDVASASTLVLSADGNTFELTGTTAVNLIANTDWQEGSKITLIANENVTINNGTATSGANITIKLAAAGNYAMTADDTLTLVLSSTTAGAQAWREVGRSVN